MNKEALAKQAEKEREEQLFKEQMAKSQKRGGGLLNQMKKTATRGGKQNDAAAAATSKANQDLDDSGFDRRQTVDKITNRVEFIYTPTY